MKSRLHTPLRSLTVVFLLLAGTVQASVASTGAMGRIHAADQQKVMLPLVITDHTHGATVVRFDRYPDRTPVTVDTILDGDEFQDMGILLEGAPESGYCQTATSAAILVMPHHIGPVEFTFLTSSEPDRLACHGVPVKISFVQPVRQVTLEFAGVTAVHIMKAYDPAGLLLGTAEQQAVWKGGTFDITYTSASSNVAWVTFGKELSTTVIKELRYVR
jgi:hypothetical protein